MNRTPPERSDAGILMVQEVFGFVKKNMSEAQWRKDAAGEERGAGERGGSPYPAQRWTDPERDRRSESQLTGLIDTMPSQWICPELLDGLFAFTCAHVRERQNRCLFRDRDLRFPAGQRLSRIRSPSDYARLAQLDDVHSVLRPSCETLKGLISLAAQGVAKLTLCATMNGSFLARQRSFRGATGQYQTHGLYNVAAISSAANFLRRASSASDGLSGGSDPFGIGPTER